MSKCSFRGAIEWALMVGLVFGAGALAQAQDENQQEERVIQIGPADEGQPTTERPEETDRLVQELPKYWIGLYGGPVAPEVRHHLDIAENQGVMIREVHANSPAAKAGLERYDVLLRANDTELHEMHDLVDLVRSEGEKQGQITLEVLRHGKRDTVTITPEERPANVAQNVSPRDFGAQVGGFADLPEEIRPFLGQRGMGGAPFDFRNFGPGAIVGGGVAGMPNGVSVSITKEGDQPAQITVKRGEETWEVVGDDPESLNQLPEDLRPFVERMLHGGGAADINFPDFGQPGRPGFDGERLRERLEQMEQRLQEMQQRLWGPQDQPDAEAEAEEQAE
jgi:membrane-associated protease RseP (regulator of RpoE activity)